MDAPARGRQYVEHCNIVKRGLNGLAEQYGINPKTVAKRKKRSFANDAPMGPKEVWSTGLTEEEEAMVAFRKYTLLPADDCLYALQPSIPHLTRSSLHRCLQRHGISRLSEVEGDKAKKQKFAAYPLGYFHIDIAEVQTEDGKLDMFVAVDRTSKFAYANKAKAMPVSPLNTEPAPIAEPKAVTPAQPSPATNGAFGFVQRAMNSLTSATDKLLGVGPN